MSVEDETWDRPICSSCNKKIPYGKKVDHLNKKCMKEDFMPRLKEIQHELKTQDNRCASDPIFLVEECERIYGMDSDYSDNYIWYNREDCYEAGFLESKNLDKLDDNFKSIPDCWVKSYYIEKWIAVQPFFTEKAAQAFLEANRHRHTGRLRVYADSLYRNYEMKMIRDYILNLE